MTASTTRTIFALGLAASLTILPAAGQERPRPALADRARAACAGDVRFDILKELTTEGDLLLASLGLTRLAGIRLPDDSPRKEKALAWLRARVGQAVRVEAAAARDRWERLPARIHASQGSHTLDLAQGLVEEGLALVDPGSEAFFCQPELLAFEETARERHLGLWADARYNPIPVDHKGRLQARIGSFVIIEGRVRSVGERKQQTYLNFGGHWADDFTIIIPRRSWKLMADRGIDAASLKGRRIRARGILQSWQGTALTIEIPEMIERVEGSRLAR